MEKNYSDQSHQCTLYPGDYFPILDARERSKAMQLSKKVNTVSPEVSVSESDSFFKVEAALPGLHREDFFISVDENILSIAVLHKVEKSKENRCFSLQEFNYDCFNRKLTLPNNVEAAFINAEYRDGMLSMYLPKSATPGRPVHMDVVVY